MKLELNRTNCSMTGTIAAEDTWIDEAALVRGIIRSIDTADEEALTRFRDDAGVHGYTINVVLTIEDAEELDGWHFDRQAILRKGADFAMEVATRVLATPAGSLYVRIFECQGQRGGVTARVTLFSNPSEPRTAD